MAATPREQQPHKIHPWHMVTKSMVPEVAITFNYDSNDLIEVSIPRNGAPPKCTTVLNLARAM